MRGARVVVGLALAALALGAAPAAAAVDVRFHRIQGYASPGTPAKYNKVGILEVGPKRAKNILVLNPGTSSSAAYFAPLAKTIVSRSPGWQVWAVERRENLLEDHSVFNRAKRGQARPQEVFDYYLGWLADDSIEPHFQSIPDSSVGFARDWGMRVQMEDLHRVVKRADRRGRRIVLGGHSLGGTMTTAYATWDFKGRAGGRDLSGLVYIDGGSRTTALTTDEAEQRLQELEVESPWLAFGGIPSPLTGLFNTAGSLSVLVDPDARSIGQQFPLLPANLKPPIPVTNVGAVRLRAGHRDLAAQPGGGAGAPRAPGRQRRPARLGPRRRADADSPLRQGVLRLGAAQPGRHGLVPPAAPDDRFRRRGGRQRQPGTAGARRPRHPRRRPSAPAADLRLRRGARRVQGAGRGPAARAAVGDPEQPAHAREPRRHVLAQRPELGRSAQRVRGPPGPVPQADRA